MDQRFLQGFALDAKMHVFSDVMLHVRLIAKTAVLTHLKSRDLF